MKSILLKLFIVGGIFLSAQQCRAANLLIDGSFSTTSSITPYYTDPPPLYMWVSWANYYGTGASFSTSVKDGVCSYLIDNPGTNMFDVQLAQFGFSLTLNHRYRLSFDVKADEERDFGVFIGEYQGAWTNLNSKYVRHATSDWQTITIDLDAAAVFPLHKLSFEMGVEKINMYFANISLVDLGPIPLDKVVIAGSFQSELGCSADWVPDCDNTALSYNTSNGLWEGSFNIPAGCHQYKVTVNGSWSVNYGENGIQGGANIYLYVPQETVITFSYDPSTHFVTTSPLASGFSSSCLPQVVLAGSFQSALGCNSDWDATCLNTALIYSTTTGLFENDFNLPGGYYEYRTVLNGDWAGGNFGSDGTPFGSNYVIYLQCGTKVHFSYDPVSHLVTATYNANPQPNAVVVAGSFQTQVGCTADWQPDCDKTRLNYDSNYGGWISDTLLIPQGQWEYKVTLNNSWDENYGQDGIRNGANIPLQLCSPAKVVFNYYHNDCYNYHYVYAQIFPVQPNTVVIAGSFQDEIGCAGDWRPDCDQSHMSLNPSSGYWEDTLMIPAGHWEYKFALNNSWDENYGADGQPNGAPIILDLCYPAKVAFSFYQYNCNGWGYAQIITNGICINKFYDANANGYRDEGEEPMSGVTFTLSGNGITQTQITGAEGKAAFSDIPGGIYIIKESVPSGYYTTVPDSQYVYVYGNSSSVYFGNACLGGAGAKGIGFWMSKQGEAAYKNYSYKDYILPGLVTLALKNADGTNFDPATWEELRTWMQKANAKNMSYMLSAQLAALYLNAEINTLGNRKIYTPQIKDWNAYNGFMDVSSLVWYTNFVLGQVGMGIDISRNQLESLKNLLDLINSDRNFVQLHPCGGVITKLETNRIQETNEIAALGEPKVWPNPSSNNFTLRPAFSGMPETVALKVYDVNGQLVYQGKGYSNKDYRFGENLLPGVYMVELVQGKNRTIIKVVKH